MTTKEIARILLNELIENHEDGESSVYETAIGRICEARKLQIPTTDELSDCVHLINSTAGYRIITESWASQGILTGLISSNLKSIYYTEKSISYLKDLLIKI